MRAVAISLLVLVLALLANIAGVLLFPSYKATVQGIMGKTPSNWAQVEALSNPEIEKLSETIERLSVGLDAMSATGSTVTSTDKTTQPATASGKTTEQIPQTKPEPPKEIVYELPILLLARLMPDVFPKQVENKWIFDVKIFSNIAYTTYRDEKSKINIYAFAETYPIMLTNLKLLTNVYTIKETDTYFDATFFLNPTNKKDTTIRFVSSINGRAVGFELPKSLYPKIQNLFKK